MREIVTSLFTPAFDSLSINAITQVKRIGQNTNDEPCKVLVTFSHEHLKNDVLKNKQKIKDKVKNLNIFLNADMAANEKIRQADIYKYCAFLKSKDINVSQSKIC